MRLQDYGKWYRYNWEKEIFPKISKNFRKKGELTKEEFLRILLFKAERGKTKFKENLLSKAKEVSCGLKKIGELKEEKEIKQEIKKLCKIKGIGVPIASALLAACYPAKFTIIDRRVCEEVFHKRPSTISVKTYLCYNRECCKRAERANLTLRELDRCYWGRNYYSKL